MSHPIWMAHFFRWELLQFRAVCSKFVYDFVGGTIYSFGTISRYDVENAWLSADIPDFRGGEQQALLFDRQLSNSLCGDVQGTEDGYACIYAPTS